MDHRPPRRAARRRPGSSSSYGVDVGADLGIDELQRAPRRGRARARLADRARVDAARPRARRHPLGDGRTCCSATAPSPGVAAPELTARGQARDRDRRRRHRRRLRGVRPPRARGVGHRSSTSTRRPRARSTASSPPGRTSRSACGRPTRSTRAASGAPPSTRPRSTARRARARAASATRVGDPPDFEPTGESHRAAGRPRADRDRLHRRRARAASTQLGVEVGERGAIASTDFMTTADGVFAVRRRAPRPVPDRHRDRRGPPVRGRGRALPDAPRAERPTSAALGRASPATTSPPRERRAPRAQRRRRAARPPARPSCAPIGASPAPRSPSRDHPDRAMPGASATYASSRARLDPQRVVEDHAVRAVHPQHRLEPARALARRGRGRRGRARPRSRPRRAGSSSCASRRRPRRRPAARPRAPAARRRRPSRPAPAPSARAPGSATVAATGSISSVPLSTTISTRS